MKRIAAALAGAGPLALLLAPDALAHGLVRKQHLLIPRWLFSWAAAIVLVISFVGLTVLWPAARWQQTRERKLVGLPALLDPLAGALGRCDLRPVSAA